MSDLPPLSQEPIQHVDASPNAAYPLRILRAYLTNTQCRWSYDGPDDGRRYVYDLMNEHCEQRAVLLRKAIAILEASGAFHD